MTDIQEYPDTSETLAATPHLNGLAWSTTEPDEHIPQPRRSWSSTITRAAAVVAAAALISAAALVLFTHTNNNPGPDWPTPPAQVTDTPIVIPSWEPPSDMPDLKRKDDADLIFQRAYRNYVVGWFISDPPQAIGYAHKVCNWMQEHEASLPYGTTPAEAAAQEIYSTHAETGMDLHDARGIVTAAARAYCPRYDTGSD